MAGKNRPLQEGNGRFHACRIFPQGLRPSLDNKSELCAPLGSLLGADRHAAGKGQSFPLQGRCDRTVRHEWRDLGTLDAIEEVRRFSSTIERRQSGGITGRPQLSAGGLLRRCKCFASA
jgi:hypothetical protein